MKKVLVVDNDRIMLGLMSRFLEKKGYQVVTAENGINALDALKTYTPDAIFIDLVMPNIDGKLLCRIIRSMEKFNDVYLIILSAISAEERVDIAKLGANACIAKGPFDEMSQHITAALNQPETTSERCLSGEILGVQGVYPRGITKELLSVKNHFEVILDKMSEGIIEINSEGRIVFANSAILSMIDIPEENLLGSYFVDLFSGDEHSRVSDFIEKMDKRTKNITEDAPLRLNKYHVTLDIVSLDKDEPKSLIILRDVSDYKLAEKVLRESEEKYRNLFETSMVAMYRTRIEDGQVIAANKACAELLGYESVDQFVAEFATSEHYTNPEQREELLQLLKTQGVVDRFEVEVTRSDGTHVNLEVSCAMYPEKGYLEGALIDITERKRAENELRKSEEKYRNIFENVSDFLYYHDLEGNFIETNLAFVKNSGFNEDELVHLNIMEMLPEKYQHKFVDYMKRVKENGKDEGLMSVITKDGHKLVVEYKSALVFDSKGRPIGVQGSGRDITDRIQAKKEKKKLETQLQQSQKMEAIGTLAGGIAHDFNNLLMGIQGRSSLLLTDTESHHPNFEHLNGIEAYVKSAADLTKQLLAFARGGKYEAKPIDLNELINRSAEMFGRTKKEITIHRKNQENIWTVEADEGQIEQVLLNLYVNAWQSMPGGGDIYLETENVMLDPVDVEPYSIEPGKYVKMSVIDTGVGMDKATQERIFDPFFTTKEMGRGTGLGLASAYGIIKNHGGIINVYSEKGKGATFNIYLPASEKVVIKEKELSKDIPKGFETILLVDDEEMITDVGKALLKKLGYKVLVAKSGEAAAELYNGNKDEIDMVILDMIMPHMSGGETYDRLKTINPNIKVLLSSGYSIDGQATEIMKRGCNGFIQKPFNIKGLSQKLREVLDNN